MAKVYSAGPEEIQQAINSALKAKEEWAKKQYLKEIEKLFSGKKEETEDQKKARKNISYLK